MSCKVTFEFENLDVTATIDPTLPITAFFLTVEIPILRKVSSTYWRPFSSYHQSEQSKKDNDLKTRETSSANEYYYYLDYLMRSPNAPKRSSVEIRANNLLYVFHDLLHSRYDVVGDTMSVSRQTEKERLTGALDRIIAAGFVGVNEEILERVNQMFIHDQMGSKEKVEMDLVQHQNDLYKW